MDFEAFKKKLLKRGSKKVVTFIFLVGSLFFFALAAFGYFSFQSNASVFNARTQYGNLKMNVRYLMGPFAGNDNYDIFIAEDDEEYWYVFATEIGTSLPIYGETIDDEGIDAATPITVYGESYEIDEEIAYYLVDFFNEAGYDEITEDNYAEYLGANYFFEFDDNQALKENMKFIVIGGVLLLFAVISLFAEAKGSKKNRNSISELEQQGLLQALYEDYSRGNVIEEKNNTFMVTQHYIAHFGTNGLEINSLDGYTNVFKSRIYQGSLTQAYFIVLEDDERVLNIPANIQYSEAGAYKMQNIIDQIRMRLELNKGEQADVYSL